MSVQCPQVNKLSGSALALGPKRTRAHLSHCHSALNAPPPHVHRQVAV